MVKFKAVAIVVWVVSALTSTLAHAQSVPGNKRDLDFDAALKTIDLDDPSWRLEYKPATNDGSSIGLFIGKGDKPTDRSFVPTNTSSVPEAEVVSYRLARFFGVSRNYYPVGYYTLGPEATAKFRDMVFSKREFENDRIVNRNMVMKELKASPDAILGIYRAKPKTKMYAAHSLGTEGQFNLGTALARDLRAASPMPGDQPISLDGIKGGKPDFPKQPVEREVELARELSTIFVIDQLLGQWDRFWGNLEASGDKNGRLKLVARDNGGATLDDWDDYEIYNRWVSRYDRDVIERLTALHAFLKGEAKEFSGFASVEAWKQAVGFIKPESYETFVKKLAVLIDKRVPSLVNQYGDDVFFPPKSEEVLRLDAADSCDED